MKEIKTEKDLHVPILTILRGGLLHINVIRKKVLRRCGSRMDSTFFSETRDGDRKWSDYIGRGLYKLKEEGSISSPKRGWWQLVNPTTSKTPPCASSIAIQEEDLQNRKL